LKASLRNINMNCPSKTDEDILLNPTWNQNPPRFAADLTTCQDLNGIANARELGDADQLCGGAKGLRRCEVDPNQFQEKEKQSTAALGKGVEGPQIGAVVPFFVMKTEVLTLVLGPYTRTITTSKDCNQAGASTADQTLPWTTLRSWACWILSVLCTSMAMSFLSGERTWSNAAAKVAVSSENPRLTNKYNT
jgi:zinc transporter 1/2/3